MSRETSLAKFETALSKSVAERDWSSARRARERLVELMLQAMLADEPEQIRAVEKALARAYMLTALEHDVDLTPGPAATAWMMKAEADAAAAALHLRPLKPRAPQDDDGLAVRDRILVELSRGNRRRLSNRELAAATKAASETITRVLPSLRAEGLVRSIKIGRVKINEITSLGRVRAAALSREENSLTANNAAVWVSARSGKAVAPPLNAPTLRKQSVDPWDLIAMTHDRHAIFQAKNLSNELPAPSNTDTCEVLQKLRLRWTAPSQSTDEIAN